MNPAASKLVNENKLERDPRRSISHIPWYRASPNIYRPVSVENLRTIEIMSHIQREYDVFSQELKETEKNRKPKRNVLLQEAPPIARSRRRSSVAISAEIRQHQASPNSLEMESLKTRRDSLRVLSNGEKPVVEKKLFRRNSVMDSQVFKKSGPSKSKSRRSSMQPNTESIEPQIIIRQPKASSHFDQYRFSQPSKRYTARRLQKRCCSQENIFSPVI
eukprot:Sdes_comp20460_c0_seq2m14687